MNEITLREFYKQSVNDVKTRSNSMYYSSLSLREFEKKGKYSHLTDEWIDNLSEEDLKKSLTFFIADCFRQR